MNLRRTRRGTTIVWLVTAMITVGLAGPSVAAAEPPTSSVEVSPTTLQPGQTFTVTEQLFNPEDFTVTGAKAAVYGLEIPIVDVAELVSCTGTVAPCSQFFSSFRAPVGDLPAGESRTVEFTLRVKDGAQPVQFTLQHQFVGDNFAFAILDGPVITVTGGEADLAVSLDASPRGVLTSTVTYTISVSNAGPADATGIRLVATYAAGLRFTGSASCTRVPDTRNVNCDIAALPAGATATASFSTAAGLLAIGPFTTRVKREQSTPGDPNPANDSAARTCSALTGLLVRC
jgi:uncharacterized repeat protein (TIGR01451 family)